MVTAIDLARVSDCWARRFFRSLRLAVVAWVAVFTVLVCAVAPAGLPLTTAQGSAFNPATTAVALQAKAPRARSLVKRLIEPGGDGISVAPMSLSALLPVAAVLVAPSASIERSWKAIEYAASALALDALPRARGPPAA